MQKMITLLLIGIIPWVNQTQSQTPVRNLEKYWYYRYRLMNDFMMIGDCQGCSMPGDIRNKSPQPSTTLSWGDATIDLGWYIGILATEYHLLRNQAQPQPLDSIRRELYYAMEAFNRIDYFAEQFWGGTASLNGFFVRDDVPAGFMKSVNLRMV